MKRLQTGNVREFFKVVASTHAAQAARMILRPGESTGEPDNEHPRSEQWVFVVSGRGRALIGRRTVPLRSNSLLLIHKDEVHQIRNTGRRLLRTLNFYSPPAYTAKISPNPSFP